MKKEWVHCKSDSLFFDSQASIGEECRVVLGDGEIEVSYLDDNEHYYYRSRELGQGHFKLRGADFDGRATSHCFPGRRVLEGYWIEDRYKGMWRIQLA